MKLKFYYYVFLLLISTSCTTNSPKNPSKGKILCYYRVTTVIDSFSSYNDILTLNNYQDKKIKVNELYMAAIKDVDTAKMPVSHIDFINGNSLPELPKDSIDSKIWNILRNKKIIISFGFSKQAKGNFGKLMTLSHMVTWHNSEYRIFYMRDNENAIDSILKSSIIVDN